ncbi:hypothetical protein F4604DRAFT_1685454 [Suillus subluteus]|nr:hypothetical protein F4604DRAFT_1685454 [Suillus subluteus]
MSHSDIRCCHNHPVQMLPHPCFTLKQFIKAIQLVQSGQIPPFSPQPYGWPYRLEGEDCALHAQHDPHQGAIDSNSHANVVEDDTDVSDVWIGPADNVNEDILPGSELDFPSSDGEESERGCQMVDVNSSVETLVNIDIDPASRFKCSTARKLHAAGTTVYYFRTLSEVKEHFQTAFNAWCSEALLSNPYQCGSHSKRLAHQAIFCEPIPNAKLPISMPPKYKSEEDRRNARLKSKRAHYARNKTTEQAKSQTRWRKHSQMSESIVAKFQDLDILYMELGYRAGVPEHNTFMKRFLTILQCIDTEGWDVISPELEVAPAHYQPGRECTAMCTRDWA